MIRKINPSLNGNADRAVVNTGGAYLAHQVQSGYTNISGIMALLEPDIGFFATSGLQNVTDTGVLFFNCEDTHPGSLIEGEIVNHSGTGVYIGFNSVTPFRASGFYLAPDESMSFGMVPVRQMWAMTAAGQTTRISAWGNYNRNSNTI